MRIDLKTDLKKSAASEKNLKKDIDRSEENRLNGQPFQIQTSGFGRSGELEGERQVLWKSKKTFSKKWKFSKKSIDNRKRNRLNGRPFQIQTSGFGRGGELERREGKVLWNLLSTIVRTSQKFFWQQLWKKSNESWWKRHHLKTDVERFKNL